MANMCMAAERERKTRARALREGEGVLLAWVRDVTEPKKERLREIQRELEELGAECLGKV